ncbi:MAG TPA: hypothetical protein PLL10_05040, partial [Elusimicrobiales bacterium]|nr:hypothetical protein [Elusimicrobiales bacterium]
AAVFTNDFYDESAAEGKLLEAVKELALAEFEGYEEGVKECVRRFQQELTAEYEGLWIYAANNPFVKAVSGQRNTVENLAKENDAQSQSGELIKRTANELGSQEEAIFGELREKIKQPELLDSGLSGDIAQKLREYLDYGINRWQEIYTKVYKEYSSRIASGRQYLEEGQLAWKNTLDLLVEARNRWEKSVGEQIGAIEESLRGRSQEAGENFSQMRERFNGYLAGQRENWTHYGEEIYTQLISSSRMLSELEAQSAWLTQVIDSRRGLLEDALKMEWTEAWEGINRAAYSCIGMFFGEIGADCVRYLQTVSGGVQDGFKWLTEERPVKAGYEVADGIFRQLLGSTWIGTGALGYKSRGFEINAGGEIELAVTVIEKVPGKVKQRKTVQECQDYWNCEDVFEEVDGLVDVERTYRYGAQEIGKLLESLRQAGGIMSSGQSSLERWMQEINAYAGELVKAEDLKKRMAARFKELERMYLEQGLNAKFGSEENSDGLLGTATRDASDLYMMSEAEFEYERVKQETEYWQERLMIAQAVKDYAELEGSGLQKTASEHYELMRQAEKKMHKTRLQYKKMTGQEITEEDKASLTRLGVTAEELKKWLGEITVSLKDFEEGSVSVEVIRREYDAENQLVIKKENITLKELQALCAQLGKNLENATALLEELKTAYQKSLRELLQAQNQSVAEGYKEEGKAGYEEAASASAEYYA